MGHMQLLKRPHSDVQGKRARAVTSDQIKERRWYEQIQCTERLRHEPTQRFCVHVIYKQYADVFLRMFPWAK